ncbi:MAG: sensor histidine kinase [Acidobacteriota bacterium]
MWRESRRSFRAMRDEEKSRDQLMGELAELRHRLARFESSEACPHKSIEMDLIKRSCADVADSLEELQTLQEELRVQNEELEKSRRAIAEERRRYRELFEQAPDAYLVTDMRGKIKEANQAAVGMLAAGEEMALLGRPMRDFILQEDRKSFSELLGTLQRRHRVRDWEIRLSPPRGLGVHASLNITVMHSTDNGDEGSVLRWLIRDVSERKEAENELKRSNEELKEFAFVASHDLREPLRKVVSFSERIMDGYGNVIGEEGRDYLRRMQNATQRMQGLLEALLKYSRVSTRVRPFSPVDLSELAREAATDLEVLIERTGGSVEIGDLPQIEADPDQMRQLFQNLIGNALKFHREENPAVRVYSSSEVDGTIRIFIQDNGIGFDEKHLDRIFAPFQRLHGHSTYEGTGMGLAICRKIVERHNGTITAKSRPGKGSTFIVALPVKQAAERLAS